MEKIAQVKALNKGKRLPGRLISRDFFEDSPENVAPRLLGKLLVTRDAQGEPLAGRIVEVEAYLGPHDATPDPAAHSHRGPTPRNLVLFGPAGHAYVYSIYGMYFCMNITSERVGLAGCLLLRAVEPLVGIGQMARNRGLDEHAPARLIASGPGRLCMALGITRHLHNGVDVTSKSSILQVREDGFPEAAVIITPRIGISHAVDLPLRFALRGHGCVSGPRRLSGSSTN